MRPHLRSVFYTRCTLSRPISHRAHRKSPFGNRRCVGRVIACDDKKRLIFLVESGWSVQDPTCFFVVVVFFVFFGAQTRFKAMEQHIFMCSYLLRVGAVRHRTTATRGCFHTNSNSITFCQSFYSERKCFSTPLGSTFAFVRPRLTCAIPLMGITGMCETAGGRQPTAAKSPLCLVCMTLLYQPPPRSEHLANFAMCSTPWVLPALGMIRNTPDI